MQTSGPPKAGVAEMTQAARDEYRAQFLVACYREFGMGRATDDHSFVACGRALAEASGLDPSIAGEALHYWTLRKCISPTQQGGGSFTPQGQETAEDMLRRIEAESTVDAARGVRSQPLTAEATARETARQTALDMIESALADLDTVMSVYTPAEGVDRVARWCERVRQRLDEIVSPSEAQRFAAAIAEMLPNIVLIGAGPGLLDVADRCRVFLRGLRADIEGSPEMLMPVRATTAEPTREPGVMNAPSHPTIERAARRLLQDGHHAQAVFEAAKALVSAVKAKSGRMDLDGASLMRTVFSQKAPILAFNGLADQSDRDEQEGMMHLYEGAVLAVRNPRAHGPVEDSPESAQRSLELLSFLANRLDEAKRK